MGWPFVVVELKAQFSPWNWAGPCTCVTSPLQTTFSTRRAGGWRPQLRAPLAVSVSSVALWLQAWLSAQPQELSGPAKHVLTSGLAHCFPREGLLVRERQQKQLVRGSTGDFCLWDGFALSFWGLGEAQTTGKGFIVRSHFPSPSIKKRWIKPN